MDVSGVHLEMKYANERCEICRKGTSENEVAYAFRLRQGKAEHFELRGEAPPAAVRVVCQECGKFLYEEWLSLRNFTS
jgi:hypothetical protein